jgi:hypothetical protein
LLTLARNVSFPADEGRCLCLGRVKLDGAIAPLFARAAFEGGAAPPGGRLSARFALARKSVATDFRFELERR